MPRLLLLALALTALALPAFAAKPLADPWQAARNLDFEIAAARLDDLRSSQPENARIAVAHAASLLARQPRTEANVLESRALLSKIAATPGPDGEKDHRILAAFLLARIDHEHLATPDLDSARAGYLALRGAHPGHPLADEAGLQLALILAYQTPGISPAEAIVPIEEILGSVSLANSRRELHLLLARLHYRELRNDAAALPHLQAARVIGCETPNRDSELDLMIGTLAARLNLGSVAARHYLAFVEARPLDIRAGTARRLATEALPTAPNP